VFPEEVLVRELAAVYARAPGAVAFQVIAPLDHEVCGGRRRTTTTEKRRRRRRRDA
jgi:hypothetical protein